MASTNTFPELPLFDLQLQPEDIEAVSETLRSGWLTMGPRIQAFEEAFAHQRDGYIAKGLPKTAAILEHLRLFATDPKREAFRQELRHALSEPPKGSA